MNWIGANLVLLIVIAVFAGLMLLVAFVMRLFGFEPDAFPAATIVFVSLALLAGYFLLKRIYDRVNRK